MEKFVTGYCPVQKKQYRVTVTVIDATTSEDKSNQPIYGRTTCQFAKINGCPVEQCPITAPLKH